MHHASSWYERSRLPYRADRQMLDSYAKWLRSVQWKLFCTFTFAWRVSDAQAAKTFGTFINVLERHYRADVGYVRGDEKRFSGCGKPACARHFHVLLACAVALDAETIAKRWTAMAGNRVEGTSASVVPYDPALDGVSYVLKQLYQPDGDWTIRKMELFLPNAAELHMRTARCRRHFQRHLDRQGRQPCGI